MKRFDFDKNKHVVSNNNRKNVDLDSSFKWNIENDLLRWKNKWYILSKFFKKELLKQNHDDSYVDHFEHEKTFDLLRRKYFWNNMLRFLRLLQCEYRYIRDLSENVEFDVIWLIQKRFLFEMNVFFFVCRFYFFRMRAKLRRKLDDVSFLMIIDFVFTHSWFI